MDADLPLRVSSDKGGGRERDRERERGGGGQQMTAQVIIAGMTESNQELFNPLRSHGEAMLSYHPTL